MAGSDRGLYEALLTEELETRLRELGDRLVAQRRELRTAEAADRIALHLSRVIQRAVETIDDSNRVSEGIRLAQELIAQLAATLGSPDFSDDAPISPGGVLRSVSARLPDGKLESLEEPLIPLLDTALLTNAPGEPGVGRQLRTEIASADRIDLVMAFVRLSGIRPLSEALRAFCESGRVLRVLTTTYTGSTEGFALELLRKHGAQIRVSYDTGMTRLHAKAWLFHRGSGYSTAYVGSSNLTHSAQVTGLEWNVRVSGARNPPVIEKIAAVFETYWNSGDFAPYDREEFRARTEVDPHNAPALVLSPVEIRLEPFQERLLEQIEMSRRAGHHRNLLTAATGTGKTVMAAVDYARLRQRLPRSRLLFVAHREEILAQSMATFRHALREPAFGERWVGGKRPQRFEHVFASIQSLHATGLELVDADQFDVVIVDEFHHAAAPSYQALLHHLKPRELLGLTATPERADGLPVLEWFDNRIAAELRLWDAIDQHRLAPFAYYGVNDGLDLRQIPWRRGGGYDVEGLSNLLTADDAWARMVLSQLIDKIADPSSMRALGFCVGVQHAQFMARVFRKAGVAAVAVSGDTPEEERKEALRKLSSGELNVVFSVDLFNEGVDVPAVDTLLLLRPTDSATLFLQQLGRGLRRHPNKAICTVLDFVGQHRREFRFDRRLRALLGGTRKHVERQVEQGFPFLPAGCHLELDPVASDIVLRNIREAVPARWDAKAAELRSFRAEGHDLNLGQFLRETGLELEDVYTASRCWSDLVETAQFPTRDPGPHEKALRRACGRLLHIDDATRIAAFRRFVTAKAAPQRGELEPREERLLRMLVASVAGSVVGKHADLYDGSRLLFSHPQILEEIDQLLAVLAERMGHLGRPLPELPDVPLELHARYTRVEILAAFGVGQGARVLPWQTGVFWVDTVPADLLAFTLDKTKGQFSPTTRYRDYAISSNLIHWESQSVTRADSETGLRYQHHNERGSQVMLFARHGVDDRSFYFLGPAEYVSHESERPMSITWRLRHKLPGDLFASFAAAVA